MTWQIKFDYRIPFQSQERPEYPSVIGRIEANGKSRRRQFYVDTGCERTVITRALFDALGCFPPSDDEINAAKRGGTLGAIGCGEFGGASGNEVIGCEFQAILSIDNGPQRVAMGVFGVVQGAISRNLLGRDYFALVNSVAVEQNTRLTYFQRP